MSTIYIPPVNFGHVEVGLFRSGHPSELNFPFLETLHLKKIIFLAPDAPSETFLEFAEEQGIEIIHVGKLCKQGITWGPLTEEAVVVSLKHLLDVSSYPAAVMCKLGRHRTGTLIGCLRKLQGWDLTSILQEYKRYAGSKYRLENEQFIELFDIDLVQIPRECPPWL
eukprot:TRINITY_DN1317_c0_g1_i1.p1 TRINITY_DN1317_c0_g1~~TRINITY_DN1317_c0_g1_i1.p1  ORF type:complete len:167 (+),score=30.61 TRINITY_DN1317_c0_g1_i1:56-556(+)